MTSSIVPVEHKIIAVACSLSAGWLLITWLLPMPALPVELGDGAKRLVFDRICPWVDGIWGVGLTMTGIWLWKGRRWGRRLALPNAVYLILLGVLDPILPVGSQRWAISMVDVKATGFVNLWCIVLGLYMLLKLRRRSSSLLSE